MGAILPGPTQIPYKERSAGSWVIIKASRKTMRTRHCLCNYGALFIAAATVMLPESLLTDSKKGNMCFSK